MKVHLALSATTVAILASAASATLRYDPMSFTRTSPSVVSYGSNPATIYGLATDPGHGFDTVGGVGPILHIGSTEYGAMISNEAIGFDNVLDFSNNEINGTNGTNAPNLVPVLYFGVSASSTGVAGGEIHHQYLRNQHASDRFTAGVSKSPLAALSTGAASANAAKLSINQTYYNAIPSKTQFEANSGAQDDADGLEVTEFKFANPNAQRSFPIFFNMDADSPSMLADNNNAHQNWKTSDVLVTPVGSQDPQKYADASSLGLSAGDVIDGLAVYDVDNDGVMDAGSDVAVFSLRAGSPFLGSSQTGGDLYVTNFQGTSQLYVNHGDLGLTSSDEIDSLDVDFRTGTAMEYGLVVTAIPEPTTLALLAGVGMLALRRR